MSLSRVLLTGATGFLGAHLTRLLVDQGAAITVLTRPGSDLGRLHRLAGSRVARVEIRTASLTDAAAVHAEVAMARPDAIVHLAADVDARATEEAEGMAALHVGSARCVAEAAIEARARLVALSTSDVYGGLPSPHDALGPVAPRSPYARTKAEADALILGLCRQRGLRAVVLRPYVIFGPEQAPRHLVPGLIKACLEGRPFPMTDGGQRRDFLYVDDVVAAICLAAEAPRAEGRAVDVCSGVPRRVLDVARAVADAIRPASGGPVPGAIPRGDQPDEHFGDPAPAADLLGWRPSVTLEQGLERTIAAFRAALAATGQAAQGSPRGAP